MVAYICATQPFQCNGMCFWVDDGSQPCMVTNARECFVYVFLPDWLVVDVWKIARISPVIHK